jgi:glycine oxidase
MQKFDIAIIGNGSVALISALFAHEANKNLKIAIIGPKDHKFSASVAAGAMHAAYCEIEDTFNYIPRDREFFSAALASRAMWLSLFDRHGLDSTKIADDTVMYVRKSGTPFEKENFEAACKIAEEDGVLEEVSDIEMTAIFHGSNLTKDSIVAKKFIGEFSIDALLLINKLKSVLSRSSNLQFFDGYAADLEVHSDEVRFSVTGLDEKLCASKVMIAAGAFLRDLIPPSSIDIPIYHAVGTAMSLDRCPAGFDSFKFVVRTPNRGGAQCGVHIVPRSAGRYYLGAGNYLAKDNPEHRPETIRYLIDTCESEIFGRDTIYNARAELLLGSRPKSLDGYPVVGPLNNFNGIFVATGTYRIGFSLAPVIAQEFTNWIFAGASSEAKYKNWNPGRKPISYGSIENAKKYYSDSRISNLIEHRLLDSENTSAIFDKRVELEAYVERTNRDLVEKHNFEDGYVVDPDVYPILL